MNMLMMLAAVMLTPWGEKVTDDNCRREYPRPQMVRENWTSLNGAWDYAITSVTNTPGRPKKWDGKIRVPYPIESSLSGVGRLLEPGEFLWYTRQIVCDPKPGTRTLLHFDGVDFMAMVFIGHNEITDVPHCGAQEPFTLDITDFVKKGENELTVCVWDPSRSRKDPTSFINSCGKQDLSPHGCFYTRASGIWQSVWMETVPGTYIEGYKVVTDIDSGTVKMEFRVKNEVRGTQIVKTTIKAGVPSVADSSFVLTHDLPAKFTCWTPETPQLYHFTAKYGKDEVRGYFAMRKFEKRRDEQGLLRFFLNNRPVFLIGTLDQGWWPDGLLTPPSVEAMAHDIGTLKKLGFNMMRKHIKVEPLVYYHLCDTMGLMVLQDLPSYDAHWDLYKRAEQVRGYGFQRLELKRMIDELVNVPSIVMWIPYNEGWSQPGEFLTHSTLDWVRRYDPTRLVNAASGCNDWEGGQLLTNGWRWNTRVTTSHRPVGECEAGDVVDLHLYRSDYPDGIHGHCTMLPANDRRVSFLGEFGGLGHPVSGHMWREPKNGAGGWGYGGIEDTKTREGLEKTYLALMDDVAGLVRSGLGGCVYTQTTDVEIEINGLMTYDRKVLKFNPAVLAEAHAKVKAAIADFGGPVVVPGRCKVSAREMFVDNAAKKRSGHMGHALVDVGGGRILDFYSNCDYDRVAGHSGYGWMEYRISDDWGRTFGPPRVLDCSKRMYEEGKHTALCEKAVKGPDGRIVLFFQITDTSQEIACEPWFSPLVAVSDDRGETFGDFIATGADRGRIYDAVCDGERIHFLIQSNPYFLGTKPEHVYKVYSAGADLKFRPVTLPFDAQGRGYGALGLDDGGLLRAYVYNSRAEDGIEFCESTDGGANWGTVQRAHLPKLIRNPQIKRAGGRWFLVGRNGGGGDGIVLYTSKDGRHWDDGVMVDRRPKGTGTGYYSNMLPIGEPGKPPRILLQYSHPYDANRVNIIHRTIDPMP